MNTEIMSYKSVFQMQSNLSSIVYMYLLFSVGLSLKPWNLKRKCKLTEVFKIKTEVSRTNQDSRKEANHTG